MAKRAKNPLAGFRAVFCDASFLIALFSKKDVHHPRAYELFRQAHEARARLHTTWLMISEALTILRYHYGFTEASSLAQSLEIFSLLLPTESQYQQALGVFRLKSGEMKLSFSDALADLLLTGPLKGMPALSFDDDFRKLGLTVLR